MDDDTEVYVRFISTKYKIGLVVLDTMSIIVVLETTY